MKVQSLFTGKDKKRKFGALSAEKFLLSMLSINPFGFVCSQRTAGKVKRDNKAVERREETCGRRNGREAEEGGR